MDSPDRQGLGIDLTASSSSSPSRATPPFATHVRNKLRRPKSQSDFFMSFGSTGHSQRTSGGAGGLQSNRYEKIPESPEVYSRDYAPIVTYDGPISGPSGSSRPSPSRTDSGQFDHHQRQESEQSHPTYNPKRRQSHFSPPTPSVSGSPMKYHQAGAYPFNTVRPTSLQLPGMGPAYSRDLRTSPYFPYDTTNSAKTTGSGVFPPREGVVRKRALSEGTAQLHRQGTLLTPGATAKRSAAELGIILGSSSHKASTKKLLPQGDLPIEEKLAKLDQVKLEAKKGNKARVEVDVVLERDTLVEGGFMRGRLDVRVRRAKEGEGKVLVGGGKLRIVGYEDVPKAGGRHIFYHAPFVLPAFAPYWTPEAQGCTLFASAEDGDGYRTAAEGNHSIPFAFRLPLNGGAKGSWDGGATTSVRYVVVGSLKLHIPEKKRRAIAHFYRPAIVYPYISAKFITEAKNEFVEAKADKEVGWALGNKGTVHLRARLSRSQWVAGQRVFIEITAQNGSSRKITSVHTSLLRDVTQYAPLNDRKHVFSWRSDGTKGEGTEEEHGFPALPGLPPVPVENYSESSSRKLLLSEDLISSAGSGSGYVGSTGWWAGVEPGAHSTWETSLQLPVDCLTIDRSRLLSVSYTIRVRLNNGASVDLPLKVVNYLSVDPPPSFGLTIPSAQPAAMAEAVLQESAKLRQSRMGHKREMAGSHVSWTIPYIDLDAAMDPPPSRPVTARRPYSLHASPRSPRSPLAGESPAATPRRPHSMLSQTYSNPNLRDNKHISTVGSYMSAVASVTEEEDMHMAEAHRRAGRQRSLAALQGNPMTPETEEHSPETHSPQSKFAPSPNVGMDEDNEVDELAEVVRDLEGVPSPILEDSEGGTAIHSEHATISERDSESQHLEHELATEGTVYKSRFGISPIFEDSGHLSPLVSEQLSHAATDVSKYDDDISPNPSGLSAEHENILMMGALDEHSEEIEEHHEQHEEEEDHVDEHEHSPLWPPGNIDMTREETEQTRSFIGSFALSVMTGEGENSEAQSEVGQVYQAERRNVPQPTPPAAADISTRLLAVCEQQGLPTRKGSSPLFNGQTEQQSLVQQARKGSAPVITQRKELLLDIPRANSFADGVRDASGRRPSAPAIYLQRGQGGQSSSGSSSFLKPPKSPGSQSLSGQPRTVHKKPSFSFAPSTSPQRVFHSPKSPFSSSPVARMTSGPDRSESTSPFRLDPSPIRSHAQPQQLPHTPERAGSGSGSGGGMIVPFNDSPFRSSPGARQGSASSYRMESPGGTSFGSFPDLESRLQARRDAAAAAIAASRKLSEAINTPPPPALVPHHVDDEEDEEDSRSGGSRASTPTSMEELPRRSPNAYLDSHQELHLEDLSLQNNPPEFRRPSVHSYNSVPTVSTTVKGSGSEREHYQTQTRSGSLDSLNNRNMENKKSGIIGVAGPRSRPTSLQTNSTAPPSPQHSTPIERRESIESRGMGIERTVSISGTRQRHSYTAALGNKRVISSGDRKHSGSSHQKILLRVPETQEKPLHLRRKGSAQSMASISTTATSIEGALMRRKMELTTQGQGVEGGIGQSEGWTYPQDPFDHTQSLNRGSYPYDQGLNRRSVLDVVEYAERDW